MSNERRRVVSETRVYEDPQNPTSPYDVVLPITEVKAVEGLDELIAGLGLESLDEILTQIGDSTDAASDAVTAGVSVFARLRIIMERVTALFNRVTDARAQALDRIGTGDQAASSAVTAGITLHQRLRNVMTNAADLAAKLTATRAANLDNLNQSLSATLGPVNATGGTASAGSANAKLNAVLQRISSGGISANVRVQRGSAQVPMVGSTAVTITAVNQARAFVNIMGGLVRVHQAGMIDPQVQALGGYSASFASNTQLTIFNPNWIAVDGDRTAFITWEVIEFL